MEDLSKQPVNFEYHHIADKLPKIVYNSVKMQQAATMPDQRGHSDERDIGSHNRVRRLDLSGFLIQSSKEPSINDERSDQTIQLTVSGSKVSARKTSQKKIQKQLYSKGQIHLSMDQ